MIDTRNKDTIQERARALPGLCKICTYTCDHYLMLKMHCEEEHRLQCYRCEKKYKDKAACKHHTSQNHNSGISCEPCGKSFKSRWKLKRHLKSFWHMGNQKTAEVFKTQHKMKSNVIETIVISDDDDDYDSCMKIINLDDEIDKRADSIAERFENDKSKTNNSQKLHSTTQNERKRKQEDETVTEASEEEVKVKKAKCLVHCNFCMQYYKNISAHLKTKKHSYIVEKQKKAGTIIAGSQEEKHFLTIDDTDQETSTHTDDDTQYKDGQRYESLSPSSDKSVVIVSDHDSYCDFEDYSNILDDIKQGSSEDGQICDKDSQQFKLSDQFQGQPQTQMISSSALKFKEHEENLKSAPGSSEKNIECIGIEVDKGTVNKKVVQETRVKCASEDANTDIVLEKRIMPVVVTSSQERICSPTMLVKNIAADLMCRKDVSPRQNIFESMLTRPEFMKVCSANSRIFENSLKSGKQSDVKVEQDTDAAETISKSESSKVKNKRKKHILETGTGSWERKNVVDVEMTPEDERILVDSKAVGIVSEEPGSADC